jgi:hypothetical protein
MSCLGTECSAPLWPEFPASDIPCVRNLLQIPVLVLSSSLKPLHSSLDRGSQSALTPARNFVRTHVRLEGDDPIALSILLDVSESDADLMPGIDELIAGLSPDFLRWSDHVSVYALDCFLTRSLYDVPADSTQLKDGVEAVLRSWNSRLRRKQAQCKKAVHLWDWIARCFVPVRS